MIDAGVRTIMRGTGTVAPGIVHRLDKADTANGQPNLQSIADLGAPYPVLLYERFPRPALCHPPRFGERTRGPRWWRLQLRTCSPMRR